MIMKIRTTIALLFFSATCFGQGKFFGGNGDGFGSATLVNVTLPLQVLHFSATKVGDNVQAVLKISSDEIVCKMILEKSTDAIAYQQAAILENMNGLQGTSFLFTDSSALSTTNYYRVRITKCSGAVQFTSVITINSKGENKFYYQSPGAIQYTVSENGKLRIINAAGQLVYESSISKGSGILYPGLTSKGIYFLYFADETPVKFLIQ